MVFSEFMVNAQKRLIDADLPINDLILLGEYYCDMDYQDILIKDPDVSAVIGDLNDALDKVIDLSIPIAYLVGFEYFYGRKIIVSKDCLIPRAETEELVYNTITFISENFPRGSKLTIADVCTGSGIVGLSVYLELKDDYDIELYVSDISQDALDICKKNMDVYNIDATILCGDSLSPFLELDQKFDVVVANPPYIPMYEHVDEIVRGHEPNVALFGGEVGSEIHYQIISKLDLILKSKYFVGFEHGEGQGDMIIQMVTEKYGKINIWKNYDMFSRERNVFFTNME